MRAPVRRMLSFALWAYLAIALTTTRADAQTSSLIDLGTLGGSFSDAAAINATGQVVGISQTASGPLHGFLWHNGLMTDLGTLGGSFSAAVAINDKGQVVGGFLNANFELQGFLWHNGVMTDLGTLGGSFTEPVAINDKGQVVGQSRTPSAEDHAFLWQDGLMTDLGTLGGSFSNALGLNDQGQVVGLSANASGQLHGFLWHNGVMTDLGTLGGSFSDAVAINGKGQVVGLSQTASRQFHAYLWHNGVMTDLGTLGGSFSDPVAINEAGQVVGRSGITGGGQHAFLFRVPTDTTPPMTSAAPSPGPNANGWNNTDVTVNLSSVDNEGGSGVKEIVYSATGTQAIGTTTVPGSSTAITFTEEGTTTLTYFARDIAENAEAPRTLIMRLDKTAPILNVPVSVTENATSPSGATVAYSGFVSATDNLDTNPIISCTPPSGSTFPIGITTVACTATDAADNTVSRTFQVTVKGASEQIVDLIVKVAKISDRDPRIPDALKAALQRALDALIARKIDAVCKSLTPFVKVVQAQAGKKITVAEANELIADANRISAVLSCR